MWFCKTLTEALGGECGEKGTPVTTVANTALPALPHRGNEAAAQMEILGICALEWTF